MPLFEYKCDDCGTTFEKIVPTYSAKVSCKKCLSPKVEKAACPCLPLADRLA